MNKLKYQEAAIPKDENERLVSLRRLNILDTPPEERFDRITRLATSLFNVPISTITLVDSKKEWFKSCQGLAIREGERAISFCGHAMLAPDSFIIPDAKKDPRFAQNPIVIGKPFIRFYAAVPLKAADGQRVGAFCLKDYRPRKLGLEQIDMLKSLAAWIEIELNAHELTQALEARRQAEAKLSELNDVLKLLNQLLRHDLLNHLTVIKGNLAYLLADRITPERVQDIELAADQSVALIEQIGRLEATVSKGSFLKALSLQEILKSAMTRFPKVKFETNGEVKVLADEALSSVIENIISNANIHGKTNKVNVGIAAKKSFIEICIADFGIGIPPQIKNKLFTKGFKYGSTGNHGLGLYIAKNTLLRYGGDIAVKDNKPKGTIFTIKLRKA
ncbi:MAG: GAF domain-containing sensor histidine kinase [Candidatus Daviesbacteria bacterium]|nr:GAF domain-containing sensor histidine kinase [Candidatus Daviesbacteria bacterium]